MSYDDPDDWPDPEPDDLLREQLAEANPMWKAVADTLDEWLMRMHGITSGRHNAGAFLEFLALEGYEVVRFSDMPSIEQLLAPAATQAGQEAGA